MAYSLVAIERDGMSGVRLTDATTQQVHDKFNQLSVAYEQSPKTFFSGAIDTDVTIVPAQGQYLEGTYDGTNYTTDYQGKITIFPPASNGSLWQLADLLVPVTSPAAPPPLRLGARG